MNAIKTVFLMVAMTVLLTIVGGAIAGQTGMIIALGISLAMNLGSYWYSDKIVLNMYGAKKIGRENAPQLFNMVERLAANANLPMPKVYVIESATPNAFATGRNPQNGAVAFTTGIIRMLNNDELEGVIAHELAHIKNRDILISTITATLVGTISWIAHFGMFFGGGSGDEDNGGGIIGMILLIILSPFIAILLQMAISRSREYSADKGGAEISGKPMGLASALEKLSYANEQIPMRNAGNASAHMFIVNPLTGGGISKLFSTHPAMEERIKRLREIHNGRC